MAAIEIVALEKTYSVGFWRKKARSALKPLTLEVPEGEVFGYLGPNGAGKTTTLKLLMGLAYPTGGSARILGRDWRDSAVKGQIGFLPEQPYFYDYLTATELLHYYGALSGVPAGGRQAKISAMLKRVGMSEAANEQLRKLSKGMLQRIGIAQAILHDPKIVFLDEPMSGLDPIGRREVRDLIQGLKDEGKTVFFSTHILSDAEALCDRVAVLNHGELRGIGAVAELTSRFSGKMEVLCAGEGAEAALRQFPGEVRTAAEITRVVLEEAQLDAALEALRKRHVRLIAVNPVRATLEDYFVEKLQGKAEGVAL